MTTAPKLSTGLNRSLSSSPASLLALLSMPEDMAYVITFTTGGGDLRAVIILRLEPVRIVRNLAPEEPAGFVTSPVPFPAPCLPIARTR